MLFFVLTFSSVFCGVCNMSTLTLYPMDDALTCIRDTMPFDPSGAEGKTIPIIAEYFENNIYAELFKFPPSPYEEYKVDVVDELKKINENIDDFNNSFDFYNKIETTINKLKDCHCRYRHGCLSSRTTYFFITLPFFFEATSNPTDKNDLIPYFRIVDHSSAYITAAYLNDSGNADLRDLLVTHIDPLGGENFQPMYKVIYDFALKNDVNGYNYHALFNNAMRTSYYMRRISSAILPPKSKFTLRVVDKDGQNPQTVLLSWYVVYQGPPEVQTWEELCPPSQPPPQTQQLPQPQLQQRLKNIPNSLQTNFISRDKEMNDLAYVEKKKSRQQNKRRPPLKMVYVDDVVADFAAVAPSPPFDDYPDFVPVPPSGKPHIYTHHHARVNKTIIEADFILKTEKRQVEAEVEGSGEVDRKSEGSGSEGVVNAARMIYNKKKKTDGAGGEREDDNNSSHVVIADIPSLQVYYLKEFNVGYINLSSFSTEDLPIFVQTFADSVRVLKITYNISDLLIDVRGNGGGYAVLVSTLMNFLFPSTLFPSDMNFDLMKTRFLDTYYASFDDEANYYFDLMNVNDVVDSFYEPNVTKTFRNMDGTSYTRTVTKQYVFGIKETYGAYLYYGWQGETGVTSPFSPQHVYIITNGICYSACGVFTKAIIDSHSARMIGVGAHPDYLDKLDRYDAGSCPAVVIYSDNLDEDRKNPMFDASKFPPVYPNQGSYSGFSINEMASINPNTHDQILFYKLHPVDAVIMAYPNYNDRTVEWAKSLAEQIHTKYITTDACFSWEVVEQPEACASMVPSDSYAVYGNPCAANGTGFDVSQCIFSRCADGYFEQLPHTCVLKPIFPIEWPDNDTTGNGTPSGKKLSTVWIVVIVVVVVVILVTIAVVIGCVMHKRVKGSGGEGYFKQVNAK